MNPARFRTTRSYLAPRWLTDGEGGLVGYALDVMKDAFVQRLRLGLLARFPETAPPDALPYLGRDRRVVRGINEVDESYVRRLLTWLDDRKTAGNPITLMQRLAEYTNAGCRFRTVDARGNWYTRNVDGSIDILLDQANWNWNAADTPDLWSRFWVIIYPNGLWLPGAPWGDALTVGWGEPTGIMSTWGTTMTANEVDTIRSIVADWKPAGTRCINTIIAFDSASFSPASPEPDGLWEHWSKNVGGVQVPARLATARYLDGVI